MDLDGKEVVPLVYDEVGYYYSEVKRLRVGKGDIYRSGFVDLDGKELTPLFYDEVGYYDPEVKRIRAGKGDKFGFLDGHAREVIPVQFTYAEIFDKGKARVMLNGRQFFIDPDGKEVAE